MAKPLRIGLVAGESSGDLLGAGLIAAIKARYPDAVFEGIGGPLMIAEGFHTHVPMERLAVMGLVEVLGRLRELLGVRKRLRDYFIENPPDLFIGIDAPDFTLGLEKQLKRAGIKTVHYVGPQIWAWRQGRVKSIAQSIDLMLVLFPFEEDFYRTHQVPVVFVGHPLADAIEMESPVAPARETLGLAQGARVLAVLPGSRQSEVRRLVDTFVTAAQLLRAQIEDCEIVFAAISPAVAAIIEESLERLQLANVKVVVRQARDVMSAADVVLSASGTATLEVSLVKRPMVVAYKVSELTYRLARMLVKTEFIALPNLLAGKALVPELLQQGANPEVLAQELARYFAEPELAESLQEEFTQLHLQLRQNASQRAADAVLQLIDNA